MIKKATKLENDFRPEIVKIDLFPRFYSYTESRDIPYMGQFCKIKVAESVPTKGTGIVVKVFDETVKELGVNS